MNILQICKKFPFPPADGETHAIYNLSSCFHQLHHSVTIASLNTNKHYVNIQLAQETIPKGIQIIWQDIDTRLKAIPALLAWVQGKPYNIIRFYSIEFEQKLIQTLTQNSYDIIQLEGLPVLLYIDCIRKYSKAKIVYRAHNVEHEIWQRLSINESNPLKRLYYSILAKQVSSFEQKHIPLCDAALPISRRDETKLKQIAPKVNFFTVSMGMHIPNTIEEKANEHDMFYLGALDWEPNIEGLNWFINHVFPIIVKKRPQTTLCIAGRNQPDDWNEIKHPNITMLGAIESVEDYMSKHRIMIVPLLSGSGVRIKIVEAMMYAKCIVTTSIGAEGIEDENTILRCDTPDAYADKIVHLLQNPELVQKIGQNAQRVAMKKYNAMQLATSLLEYYKQCLLV